jgi:plasmid stabilization system protein ParE
MPRVFLTRPAEDDLRDAVAWYQANVPHVVGRFRQATVATMRRIEANPLQFPASASDTRKAAMAGFPYMIVFRHEQGVSYVIAVFHMRRDPRSWQARK